MQVLTLQGEDPLDNTILSTFWIVPKDPLLQGRRLAVSHQDDTQGVPQRVIEVLL